MEIRRDFYLEKLIKRKSNGLIKVITGIRRCGKSYLLNNIFYHHLLDSGVKADHIIRFAFDSADDLYLIGESLIQIEKEKRGVDRENEKPRGYYHGVSHGVSKRNLVDYFYPEDTHMMYLEDAISHRDNKNKTKKNNDTKNKD